MRTELVEKIQKLMRLTTSSNPNESALAMQKAEELMKKHNLGMLDILEGKEEQPLNKQVVESGSKRFPSWKLSLLSSIASTFDCGTVRSRGQQELYIVGMQKDTELVYHFYHFLVETIHQKAKGAVSGRKNINTFCINASYEVGVRLHALYQKMNASTSECRDIVLAKKQMVNDYLSGFSTRTIKMRSNGEASAALAGRAAGRTIPLNKPIQGGSQTALN